MPSIPADKSYVVYRNNPLSRAAFHDQIYQALMASSAADSSLMNPGKSGTLDYQKGEARAFLVVTLVGAIFFFGGITMVTIALNRGRVKYIKSKLSMKSRKKEEIEITVEQSITSSKVPTGEGFPFKSFPVNKTPVEVPLESLAPRAENVGMTLLILEGSAARPPSDPFKPPPPGIA